MAEDLRELERWLAQMVQNLTPGERMRALRRMGGALGTSTGRRIAAQQNPDGSAFVPRKKGKPRRTGQPKSGPMFRRLRMARFLRKQVDQDRLFDQLRRRRRTHCPPSPARSSRQGQRRWHRPGIYLSAPAGAGDDRRRHGRDPHDRARHGPGEVTCARLAAA